jgi:hypothetical protein
VRIGNKGGTMSKDYKPFCVVDDCSYTASKWFDLVPYCVTHYRVVVAHYKERVPEQAPIYPGRCYSVPRREYYTCKTCGKCTDCGK